MVQSNNQFQQTFSSYVVFLFSILIPFDFYFKPNAKRTIISKNVMWGSKYMRTLLTANLDSGSSLIYTHCQHWADNELRDDRSDGIAKLYILFSNVMWFLVKQFFVGLSLWWRTTSCVLLRVIITTKNLGHKSRKVIKRMILWCKTNKLRLLASKTIVML